MKVTWHPITEKPQHHGRVWTYFEGFDECAGQYDIDWFHYYGNFPKGVTYWAEWVTPEPPAKDNI